MFVVVFYTSDGYKAPVRTSNPEVLVEKQIENWLSKGFWVEPPLFPEYPREYLVYKGGKRVASMTVKEEANK